MYIILLIVIIIIIIIVITTIIIIIVISILMIAMSMDICVFTSFRAASAEVLRRIGETAILPGNMTYTCCGDCHFPQQTTNPRKNYATTTTTTESRMQKLPIGTGVRV